MKMRNIGKFVNMLKCKWEGPSEENNVKPRGRE
jgi:hypothetical protein